LGAFEIQAPMDLLENPCREKGARKGISVSFRKEQEGHTKERC
jgi:hypothetical protein